MAGSIMHPAVPKPATAHRRTGADSGTPRSPPADLAGALRRPGPGLFHGVEQRAPRRLASGETTGAGGLDQAVLHRDVDAFVGRRVAEDIHRVAAGVDDRELLAQEATEQDHALVRVAELLEVAFGDGPLRHPRHHVLAQHEVRHELAALVRDGDLIDRDALLRRLRPRRRGQDLIHHVIGVRVVHRHAELERPAHSQYVWEQDWMPDPPRRIVLRCAEPHAPLDDPMGEHVEADLQVMSDDALHHALATRVSPGGAAHDVLVVAAVEPLGVDGVQGVLHALHPVAGDHRDADVAPDVVHHQKVPPRQQGSGLGAEVGEHEAAELLDRIGRRPHAVLEGAAGKLGRHLDAAPLAVEHPAVVAASEAVCFGDAVAQRHPTVRTALADQAEPASAVAEQHQILSKELDPLDGVGVQIGRSGDGEPVPAQQRAHGSSGSNPRQALVLISAQHRLPPFRPGGSIGRVGGWDPYERFKDQAYDSISAEVLYPTRGTAAWVTGDPELEAACYRAYNDWMIEFCGVAPQRFWGLAMISLWNIEHATQELERFRKGGLR